MESPLPDVSGQDNGGGGTGQAGKAAGAEAHYPGGKLGCPAELVKRDAEQECAEEAGAEAALLDELPLPDIPGQKNGRRGTR